MSKVLQVGELVAARFELGELTAEAPGYSAYRATDRSRGHEVELWWLRRALVPDGRWERVLGAAAEASRLGDDPCVRRILDAGQHAGGAYLVVEAATEIGLPGRLGGVRPAADEEICHYAEAIGRALAAASAAGLTHGRLVPGDVVGIGGAIKVGGIGLYRNIEPAAAAQCWQPLARYQAPEVRGGERPGPTADVYSLAVIVAEMAAGISGRDRLRTLRAVATRRVSLAETLKRGLSDDPEQRPTDALAFALDVAAALGWPNGRPAESVDGASASEFDAPTRHHLNIATGVLEGDDEDFADHEQPTVSYNAADLDPALLEDLARPVTAPPAPGDTEPEVPVYALAGAEAPVHAASAARRGSAQEAAPGIAGPAPLGELPVAGRPEMAAQLLQAVSMKPAAAERSPQAPAAERPPLRPVLRDFAEVVRRDAPAAPAGNYAAPRSAAGEELSTSDVALQPSRRRQLRVLLLGAGGALLIGAVWWAGDRLGGPEPATVRRRVAAAGAVDGGVRTAAPVASVTQADAGVGLCPPGMVPVTLGAVPFCLDAHEWPGRGQLPRTGVNLTEAERSCTERGGRLCTAAEWEEGCRGRAAASWPYGNAYRPGVCNTNPGAGDGTIAAAGSLPGCTSAAGAFDMSGNVAEWVAGGQIKGGSAIDGSDGRCSTPPRRSPAAEAASDVGFRCCARPAGR